MKIAELVKTYRLINDPNAPDWNVKFVGALAVLGLVAAGGIAIFLAGHEAPAGNQAFASSQTNADGTKTDYVGFDAATFDPARAHDQATLDVLLSRWSADHPNVDILSQAPVQKDGLLIGWDITYRG